MDFVATYLHKLGLNQALPTDPVARLRLLHQAHLQHIPFNNIDLLLGRRIELTHEALVGKVLTAGHGGYCYELNGLFAELLGALGYQVRSHLGRVLVAGEPLGAQPRTHQCLSITLDNGDIWIADVGFGANSLREPARLQDAEPFIQLDTHLHYQQHEGGWLFEFERRHHWSPLYWFDFTPVTPADCAMAHFYTATYPGSPFLGHLMAMRQTESGRITFNNLRMTHQDNGARHEQRLDSADALCTALNAELLYPISPADAAELYCHLAACPEMNLL